jgi:hypothetical protein
MNRLAVLPAVVWAAAAMGQPAPQDANPAAERRGFLVYDEQKISDHDRWELYNVIIKASDPTGWRTVTTDQDTSLRAIIKRYYLFEDQPGEQPENNLFKETVDGLKTAIQKRNGLDPNRDRVDKGTTLRIPPVPVRGHVFNADTPHVRIFDPAKRTYTQVATLTNAPVGGRVITAATTRESTFRDGRLTAIEVDETKVADVVAKEEGAILPETISLKTSDHNVRISLLEPTSQGCDPEGYRAFVSPHSADAEATLVEYRQRAGEVAQSAPPLVIVDWDTDDETHGHGSKVVNVVYQVLDELKLQQLRSLVKPFDLNPRNNQQGLKQLFDDYKSRFSGDPAVFQEAEDWIAHPPSSGAPGDVDHDINETILQAIFWRYMFQEPTWLNLSFSFNYPQMNLLFAAHNNDSQSFVIVAAGNTGERISSDAYPQVYAASRRNVVNVTYGRSDGTVLGTRSGDVPVQLLARGCGFEHGTVKPDNAGSSFASPYVATMTWIRYIFNTSTLPKNFREQVVIPAVHPAPFKDQMVTSDGTFEPEMLFANAAPHIQTRTGSRSLAGAKLHIDHESPDFHDHDRKDVTIDEKCTNPEKCTNRQLAAFECPAGSGRYCLWYFSNGMVTVDQLDSVEIEYKDGSKDTFTPESFAKNVGHACF